MVERAACSHTLPFLGKERSDMIWPWLNSSFSPQQILRIISYPPSLNIFLNKNPCTCTSLLGSCIQNLPSIVGGAQVTSGKPAFIPDMEIPVDENKHGKQLACDSCVASS